jgi:hypothetical protein
VVTIHGTYDVILNDKHFLLLYKHCLKYVHSVKYIIIIIIIIIIFVFTFMQDT